MAIIKSYIYMCNKQLLQYIHIFYFADIYLTKTKLLAKLYILVNLLPIFIVQFGT